MQQMEPAKQAKIIQDFQKQSAQMDMTVRCFGLLIFEVRKNRNHCFVSTTYGL